MINISALFTQYYSTYFYAYGGLELGLTQVKYHNFGFEDSLLYTGFSDCQQGGCQFDMSIESRSQAIGDTYESYTTCADMDSGSTGTNDLYIIDAGDCFITPLFYDSSTGFDPESFTDIGYSGLLTMDLSLRNQLDNEGTSSETYIVQIVDEDLENYTIRLEPQIGDPLDYDAVEEDIGFFNSSPDNKNFLIVANATGDSKEFCREVNSGELVRNYVTIVSIGSNNVSDISFGAIKAYELPPFLCYGTINPE